MRSTVSDMMGEDPSQSFLQDGETCMNYLRKFSTYRPRKKGTPANDNHPERVTRMVAFNGGCSTTSGMTPITLVRLACIDGVAA